MSIFTNPASTSKENAQAYTDAILGLLGDRDPMPVLAGTAAAVRSSIAGLDRATLTRPEAPGKWSIAQVLQHLADSDLVWGFRLRMTLAHDRPPIAGYDQDLWATRLHYELADAAEALEQFDVLRRANLRLVGRASRDELARVQVHAERGEESVAHSMLMYAGHDLLHVAQVARIRAAVAPAT